ncbi:MAG: stage V sporulation protein AD [Eubacteriaceae bacterium]|nr:stage V sporulation protein AD [Eubacteriaceae bacterium]
MAKKIGPQTVKLRTPVAIESTGSVAGTMEGLGPLGSYFDLIVDEDNFGDTFEKTEIKMHSKAIEIALQKIEAESDSIDLFVGGDLLNQIVAATFAISEYSRPYWGVYSACASFAESLQIAATTIEAGVAERCSVSVSSHFSSVERQYRTPLEQGSQSAITSQRTVTASGGAIIGQSKGAPTIVSFTTGKIVDFDCCDIADMGTAMAPAAAHTIITHFLATKTSFKDYDLVVTGDLANLGFNVAKDLLASEGYVDIGNFSDCGKLVFDTDAQNVGQGGSGAGCSASVFCSYIYKLLDSKQLSRVLFVPTGALMSPLTSFQDGSIPAIAHAVQIAR